MIASVEPLAAKAAAPTYQLRIVLLGSKPAIWRRLLVPGDANLGWLHAVLQTALGWTNSHLHHFLTADARYADPRYNEDIGEDDAADRDEAKATLTQIAPNEDVSLGYEYDFGDSWEHEIMVEKILACGTGPAKSALCIDGARACPPEDCGGIRGYADLLKILKSPKHPEYARRKEWIGGAFEAETFDREKVNRWLGKLKWPRVTDAQLRKVLIGRDNYSEK